MEGRKPLEFASRRSALTLTSTLEKGGRWGLGAEGEWWDGRLEGHVNKSVSTP
jgi:hypothetical protein